MFFDPETLKKTGTKIIMVQISLFLNYKKIVILI